MRSLKSRKFLIPVLFAFFFACIPLSAPAQTYTVLHTFQGPDGAGPVAAVTLDRAGNIYGTTNVGGAGTCSSTGCGTLFVLNKAGKEIALHSFRGSDGAFPLAGLLRDSGGNLFGTTDEGGSESGACGREGGCGVAFRFSPPKGKEVEYEFQGAPDGDRPQGSLVEDPSGNFYGTTQYGGEYGFGTVFKIDGTTGRESVLYSFTGGSDGCFPYGVVLDSAGNLYGATTGGGNGFCDSGEGVAYKIDPEGNETVLVTFGGQGGAYPDSILLLNQGNLYGTTEQGGSNNGGVVFELSAQQDGSWSGNVLYSFCSLPKCADGQEPAGGLVRDSQGNLFGTTVFGGSSDCNGCGVVFELASSGTESVLYTFTGGSDGADPEAGLVMDGLSNLYGTTSAGGATCYNRFTCGVVFKITP